MKRYIKHTIFSVLVLAPMIIHCAEILEKSRLLVRDGETLLTLKIKEENFEEVRRIAEQGGDISWPNSEGNSPVMVAISTLKATQEKLNKKEEPKGWATRLQQEEKTHLVFISFKIAKFLLQKGADTQTTNNDLKTALHLICSEPPTEHDAVLIQHLINTHPSPKTALNAWDENKITPLSRALRSNLDTDSLDRLCHAGATLTKQDIEKIIQKRADIQGNKACKHVVSLLKEKAKFEGKPGNTAWEQLLNQV